MDSTASMRPPEFTGGKERQPHLGAAEHGASMRPPEFTGGKDGHGGGLHLAALLLQ